MCFEDWYARVGYEREEQLREWLHNIPDFLDLHDIDVYDEDEFIHEVIRSSYEQDFSEYEDYKYHEWKDSRVNLGDNIATN